MNKLLTNITGGFPFTLDDLRFQDDSVRLAIADICLAIAQQTPVVAFGCALTVHSGYVAVSEGAIIYNSEVFHVFPHNIAYSGAISQYYWNIVAVSDPAGSKTFENGETHQVYEVRKAVGSINAPLVDAIASFLMSDAPELSSPLRNNIIIAPASGFTKAPLTWQNVAMLDKGKVSLEIGISAVVGFGGNTVIATLPVGYRPKQAIGGAAAAIKSVDQSAHFAGYLITTNGNITITTPTIDSGEDFTIYIAVPAFLI